MHNFSTETHVFNFNSDFSGQCIITNIASLEKTEIPCSALFDFVAYRVSHDRLAKLAKELDTATTAEILGLSTT